MLHILKSPLNLKHRDLTKFVTLRCQYCVLKQKKKIKLVTLSSLQGESQVNVFCFSTQY